MRTQKNTSVAAYIAAAPKDAQKVMKRIRAAIKAAAPEATEKISYGMPFYEYKYPGYKGRLVYFGAFKDHVSLFAWGKDVDHFPELKKYKVSKSAIHFPLGTKVPVALIKKVVRARKKALDAGVG